MPFEDANWVWMNNEFVPWEKATVHVSAHALHYGSGVFEGIRCYDTPDGPALFRVYDHITRFYCSAQTHGMKIPYGPEHLADAMAELIRRNEFSNCYVRPICFYGSHDLRVTPQDCPLMTSILAWPWAPLHGSDSVDHGLRVCISTWKKFHSSMMPATAKASGQYVNSMLALREATQRHYDEAILLDVDGNLAEASSENIFLIRDGCLWTNDERHSILLGITRDSVIQIARNLGYQVTIGPLTVENLKSADEIFLTGTAAEIVPVLEVDENEIGDGHCGVITRRIQEEFRSIVSGRNAAYLSWLQPIHQKHHYANVSS